jgi:maleylacetate reductase
MTPFTYTALPVRVVFGHGTVAEVGREVKRLGRSRALVLSTPAQQTEARKVLASLDGLEAGFYGEAAMHTPTDVTERGLAVLRSVSADCLVSFGGGSTTGLSKALAFRTGLPQVVIPTTYAGSEATPILGETAGGLKETRRTLDVLPETIVYDVDLTLGLPVALSVTSGLNAMAHAVEALYARDANPMTSQLARDGVRSLARALPRIAADAHDREARSDALFGAWACGTCLGTVGMALHHKLCHVLGGTFDLPHSETHAVLLPHVLAYNAEVATDAMHQIADSLGAADAVTGMFDLGEKMGAPMSLRALGMREGDLARAADIAVASPYWNPRPVQRDAIERLLRGAFEGRRPGADVRPTSAGLER